MEAAKLLPPAVTWAQREKVIYLTIILEDCKDPVIKIEKDSVYFKGVGGTEQREHEIKIDLYADIIPASSKFEQNGRAIEFVLVKENGGPYWPRLTKLKERYHWLKIDFARWQDEDDSENEDVVGNDGTGGSDSFNDLLSGLKDQVGPNRRKAVDIESNSDDSDDEVSEHSEGSESSEGLPDLE